MRYAAEHEIAVAAAREAGQTLLNLYRRAHNARRKADGSWVTDADIAANDLLERRIRTAFPDDSIVSEERGGSVESSRAWYIDPLDGTSGFVHGTDEFAVHIGLAVEGDPVLGVVYRPTHDRLWTGIAPEEPLYTGPAPSRFAASVADKREAAAVHQFFGSTRIIGGSEGLRLMLLADGEAHYRVGNLGSRAHGWDLCAPHAILLARGMQVTSVTGDPLTYGGPEAVPTPYVAAANAETHRQVLKAYQEQIGIESLLDQPSPDL